MQITINMHPAQAEAFEASASCRSCPSYATLKISTREVELTIFGDRKDAGRLHLIAELLNETFSRNAQPTKEAAE